MQNYIIIETYAGFTVAVVPDGGTAEDVARDAGGVIIDAGPYDTYEKAQDVLLTLDNPYEEQRPHE